ncbi:hypothetical protein, partial [Aquamicrobium sp.]|uniref:hypothetical protein n=1 Tax=Aquamicrobium sp. TaxID=1872579 RepID=UPI00258B82F8
FQTNNHSYISHTTSSNQNRLVYFPLNDYLYIVTSLWHTLLGNRYTPQPLSPKGKNILPLGVFSFFPMANIPGNICMLERVKEKENIMKTTQETNTKATIIAFIGLGMMATSTILLFDENITSKTSLAEVLFRIIFYALSMISITASAYYMMMSLKDDKYKVRLETFTRESVEITTVIMLCVNIAMIFNL